MKRSAVNFVGALWLILLAFLATNGQEISSSGGLALPGIVSILIVCRVIRSYHKFFFSE